MSDPRAACALALPPRDGAPAYRWLCAGLRSAILEGHLRPGTRLPATRDLARAYGLSRGTIVAAFEHMKAEGYVAGRLGSGTYVNTVLPDTLLDVGATPRAPRTAPPQQPRRLSDAGKRVRGFPSTTSAPGPARRCPLPWLGWSEQTSLSVMAPPPPLLMSETPGQSRQLGIRSVQM